MEDLEVTYHVTAGDAGTAEERARALALEQTVELPRTAVPGVVARAVVGRVVALEPVSPGTFRVVIAYPALATAGDPAQLLNLLFGNASLQKDVELRDIEPPPALVEVLRGPRFGIEGFRQAAGVQGRPLTCAALKPMGSSPEWLSRLCLTFARAGIDVVKDDHGLADAPGCPFEERVRACLGAIERSADETGRRALYVPNVIGPPSALARQVEIASELGVGAIMAAPLVIGLPAFWELCVHGSVPVLAHPSFAGTTRIAIGTLLGSLFRLYGADAVVFPHHGGRFPFTASLCDELAARMRRPWARMRRTLPVPAGGMTIDRVREMVAFYGPDVMFLVGGTLYQDGSAYEKRSREFVSRVWDAAIEPSEVGR